MDSLRIPPSLKKLEDLSLEVDADGLISFPCIGPAYPAPVNCNRRIGVKDELLLAARESLATVLAHGANGMHGHGPGLFMALESIAHGFSCPERHRTYRIHVKNFPFYWLALDSLPDLLDYLGFEGSSQETAISVADRVRAAVEDLDATRVWFVHNAVKKLDQKRWLRQNDSESSKSLKELLKEKFDSHKSNKDKIIEWEAAQRQWLSCRSPLNADVTPSRPSLPAFTASAPQLQRNSIVGGITPHHSGSSSAPRPLGGRVPKFASAGSSTTLANMDRSWPPGSRACDEDEGDGKSSAVPGTKRKRSQARSISPCDHADQVMREIEEQPTPSRPPRSSRPFVGPSLSCTSNERHEDASHKSEVDTGDDPIHQSSTTPITSLEDASLSDLQDHDITTPNFPIFYPFEEPKDVIEATRNVFQKMREKLTDKSKNNIGQDSGHIYALSIQGHPAYIKIGRTKTEITNRKRQLEKCAGVKMELFNRNDHFPVVNHQRVERLIHAELQPYRRKYACHCRPSKLDHCDQDDGWVEHGEWFEIEPSKAREVVDRWRKWMSWHPYSGGELREEERLRIDYYFKEERNDEMVMEDDKGNESWRWDIFMRFSRWQLLRFRVSIWLYNPRPKRPGSCSRWDSLRADWESNVLFGLTFFIFSRFLVEIVALFPSLLAFAPVLALLCSVLLGGFAVLYAA